MTHTVLQQAFSVHFQYKVCFTHGLFDPKNSLLADHLRSESPARIFVVLDQGLTEAHPDLISKLEEYFDTYKKDVLLCAAPMIVPGGEASKNDEDLVRQIVEATHLYGIDRHSYIMVIGGGAVLDMVGFAAAISHRGVRHIRIPTTVLSQNDSGVGVKNSINYFGKKNYIGTFATPYLVINDFDFLKTLDDRDWRSGLAEAIKVALIKDADFFQWLEKHALGLAQRAMEPMKDSIIRCAKMHLDHIAGKDPFEMGSSRPLDFGHWAAHKLENLTNFDLRHGEAVAIGIALDSTYSFLKGWIGEADIERILKLITDLGFDLFVPELTGDNLIKGLEEFREHLGGRLTIMLLKAVGKGEEVHEMDTNLIRKAIAYLESKHKITNLN
ncbi:3-dehydroquinate synthase [Cecembia calidifontis]|uniref:3-dehydroquinate synthase n=1 Tax=Cecembia calidifontis TaxID=1187080 RepID=A0A4Q7PA36_9BACT|nr:3-dehydroquinate synthase [Cecembia calidifontis]RZS96400.1 3-dehydroquinate synthase [Cecembia calidifontis]